MIFIVKHNSMFNKKRYWLVMFNCDFQLISILKEEDLYKIKSRIELG